MSKFTAKAFYNPRNNCWGMVFGSHLEFDEHFILPAQYPAKPTKKQLRAYSNTCHRHMRLSGGKLYQWGMVHE